MRLILDDQYEIADLRASDREAYVEYLNDPQIYAQTLSIPSPYTLADADAWILRCAEKTAAQGRSSNWGIREISSGRLVGGIGFLDYQPGAFRAEIGYWLARPYWTRGIVSRAVQAVLEYGFAEMGLLRITANVFYFNDASARVLEKNGFQLEGILRSHYRKDGRVFDGKLYGRLKVDILIRREIPHRGEFYRLRPANENDIPAIRRLVNAAYKELADRGLNYTATYQDEETTRRRLAKGRALVLEEAGEVIGTVLLSPENQITGRHSAYVSQLAVHPRLKRRGLGTLLMETCENWARMEGYECLQLDTAKPAEHLVGWYKNRGYRVVGETRWEGKTYESWIFELDL